MVRKILIKLVIIFCSLSVCTAHAAQTTPTTQELLNLITRRFDALKDYKCQFNTTKLKNNQPTTDTHNYFFKKPKLIRLEVTNGNDKGAKAVFNKQGKVRAKAGGVLGLFTVTMEPNDKRLQDDDGSTFVTTDLGSTINDIKKLVSQGTASIKLIEGKKRVYHLQIERPNKKDLIIIDHDIQLPIEWYSFRNGHFDSKTEWSNLSVDTGLPDSLFEL